MSKLDERLKQLALEAQQYPAKSQQRQRILGKLIAEIQNSNQLYRPQCPSHLQGLYEEIYQTAKQNLFRYICENIERYHPQRGEVLQWVNFLLTKRFPDAIRELTNSARHLSQDIKIVSLDELDNLCLMSTNDDSNLSLSEQIIRLIQEDPEGIFEKRKMQSNPSINFKIVALKRAEKYEWDEIASELGSKLQALSNFYQRSLKKFAPIIQAYLAK